MSGTVFITGAGGFVGQHLVQAYVAAGARVAAIGHGAKNLGAQVELEADVDIISLRDLLSAAGLPQAIIHCAGGSTVSSAANDPRSDFQRTIGSTRHVLAFMRDCARDARLVFASSAAVYGATSGSLLSEHVPTSPVSVYGGHKAAAEAIIRGWSAEFRLDAVILRLFSIYGPGLRKQLLWELSERILRGEKALHLYGTGEEQRDFIEVGDVVRLIMMAADRNTTPPRVVNAGLGRAISIKEAVATLLEAFGLSMPVHFTQQEKPGDPLSLVANTERLREFGFEPRVPFEIGISSYVEWAQRTPTRDH